MMNLIRSKKHQAEKLSCYQYFSGKRCVHINYYVVIEMQPHTVLNVGP